MKYLSIAALTFIVFAAGIPATAQKVALSVVSEKDVRAEMYFLASDAMQGRGSGTMFERVAAEYIGSQFMQFGLEPAGEMDPTGRQTYIQTVTKPARNGGEARQTWNAMGKITGTDKMLKAEVILLTAHLDHLGVRENAAGDDKIFNGADDDASGSIAVLELARVLGKGIRPKRTVYFVCFGSEERGGYGATYFVDNLPFSKEKLVANLEFEMIGRPDAKVKADELWLTGFGRSNLGSELVKRGAKLVADPHPEENFFQRSDNIKLARAGVVAHTVSSFGLHGDYHHVTDEIRTIDFVHMTRSINSMVGPIRWLVNTSFKPTWAEGGRPN